MSNHTFKFPSGYLRSFYVEVSKAVDALATTNAVPQLSSGQLVGQETGFLLVHVNSLPKLDAEGEPIGLLRDDKLYTIGPNEAGEPAWLLIGSLTKVDPNQKDDPPDETKRVPNDYLGLATDDDEGRPFVEPVELKTPEDDDWPGLLAPITVVEPWWFEKNTLGNVGQEARLLHRVEVPAALINAHVQNNALGEWDSGWKPPTRGMITITLKEQGSNVLMSVTIDLDMFHRLPEPGKRPYNGGDWTFPLRVTSSGGKGKLWEVSRSAMGTIQFFPNNTINQGVNIEFWLVADEDAPSPTYDTDSTDPRYWTGP